MPKARVEKVLSDDGTTKTIEVEVGERGVTKLATYEVPSNANAFQALMSSLKDESLTRAYALYVSAVDRQARASVYESLASESTMITVGQDKHDIMEFPLDKIVKAFNGMKAVIDGRMIPVELTESDPAKLAEARQEQEKAVKFGPWRTAAKRLVEAGKARLAEDGTLTAA